MIIEKELAKIVGDRNVSHEAATLNEYSKDMSFVNTVRPSCVVRPRNTGDIEKIVKLANETLVPLPRVAHINEESYVVVATDDVIGDPAQRLVVYHDPSQIVHNPLDLAPYAKGPVTDVLVDEVNSMVYVIARGNSTDDGSITGISSSSEMSKARFVIS